MILIHNRCGMDNYKNTVVETLILITYIWKGNKLRKYFVTKKILVHREQVESDPNPTKKVLTFSTVVRFLFLCRDFLCDDLFEF